jgi:hypothetical protein
MPDTCIPPQTAAYLAKRAESGPWRVNDHPGQTFAGAIVIPSLAESVNLPQTLESLSRNRAELLDRHLILIVVNQRADASAEETANNLTTLSLLPQWQQQYRLKNLRWIDAATPGRELPPRQGVGLARKIGLDLALSFLDYRNSDPLLICLDADTLVQPDYIAALSGHFAAASAGGAVIPYRHRPATDQPGQSAIDRYELFLRLYVLGLGLAGSPYAFHTVGSAMACRASAYVASGGMNRRLAGEDFYFLQQVHKTSGVSTLTGTIVHPSPRSSHRVPFGTGRSVGDMLSQGEQRLLFYHPAVFAIVGEWLNYMGERKEDGTASLLEGAVKISPALYDYLEQAGFPAAWENLRSNNREPVKLMTAFHGWFDAFRTMRLIHHLSDQAYPRIAPEAATAPLFEQAGYISPATIAEQLELVRRLQGAG